MLRESVFCIKTQLSDKSVILKSTKTGAVAKLSAPQETSLQDWLKHQNEPKPDFIDSLCGINEILVDAKVDEFASWQNELLETRNNQAKMFSLHLEPTMQCQLDCGYCVEKGIDRGSGMTDVVFQRSLKWLDDYCESNPEVKLLRLIFFGGEPLLRKDIVKKSAVIYSQLAKRRQLEYMTEITTNGELLTEEMAQFLSHYNWRRVQITLDGPAEIHNARRHGKNGRPTFDRIWSNILMLAHSDYISTVDVRLSLDNENAEYIPRLIEFMTKAGVQDKIRLSIGFTESSFFVQIKETQEEWQAKQALRVWKCARDNGFKIPDEYTTGPLCVAQAKHSAVLQPDGSLQKCFCTSGLSCYRFGHISAGASGYAKDIRYENFDRINGCIKEKCAYLPICGGGCTYHAAVENGGTTESFSKQHCKKVLLQDLNDGLLRLSYGSQDE